MAQIIPFPVKTRHTNSKLANIQNDPYYLFLKDVLTTANSCGFKLPYTVDSAVERVYQKTKHKSQLAKMMRRQAK